MNLPRTYNGQFDDTQYSFQYAASDQLFPSSRWAIGDHSPLPPKLTKNVLISVDEFRNLETNHIDFFIAYMNTIVHKFTYELSTIKLGDIQADYIVYSYSSFDTGMVSYFGIFVSFVYEGYAIDIDFLNDYSIDEAEKAFNRFVDTFVIGIK